MDSFKLGNTYFIHLSQSDCRRLIFLGYDYFDVLFNQKDWNSIKTCPRSGLYFSHSAPQIDVFLNMSFTSIITFEERIKILLEHKERVTSHLLKFNIPFPSHNEEDSLFD